jgi:hypothetical protein
VNQMSCAGAPARDSLVNNRFVFGYSSSARLPPRRAARGRDKGLASDFMICGSVIIYSIDAHSRFACLPASAPTSACHRPQPRSLSLSFPGPPPSMSSLRAFRWPRHCQWPPHPPLRPAASRPTRASSRALPPFRPSPSVDPRSEALSLCFQHRSPPPPIGRACDPASRRRLAWQADGQEGAGRHCQARRRGCLTRSCRRRAARRRR